MGSRLNPYLSFRDNAREAMEFYQSVFGGELAISTFGEFGPTDGVPADGVMHAQLDTPSGYTLMASDTPEAMGDVTAGNTIAVSLSGDDVDELSGYFAKLCDGGTVTMPLAQQMWGDHFGMVTDRFGNAWMVNIAGPDDEPPTANA
ncbi:MAG: VOC family protein [Terracoccus sp.]